MSSPSDYNSRWQHLKRFSEKRWVKIVLTLLIVTAVIAVLFVRRHVVEYHQGHSFSIRDVAFFPSAHALADPLIVKGNKIEILENGDQIFAAMLEAIAGARKTVNFEAFLFYSGDVGSRFRDAFCERARAGVHVRVLLDGLGSSTKLNNEDVEAMRKAGCDVQYYHPMKSWRVDRINRRSHRRVLVVDGCIGFTGSVGFADHWRGNADNADHWRDLHVRIEGPLVTNLQGAFQQHWIKERREPLTGADDFPELQPAGDIGAQLVASHSFSVAPMPLLQAVTLASAEQRVWIVNSYFWPAKDQVEQLSRAAQRGVDVRLIVPGPHDDQPLTKAGGRQAFGDLLKAGVKIFEYQPSMIHAKTMVADGMFAVLGSSNFDARSGEINEELDLTVYNERFAKQMERIFEEDQKKSRQYTLQDFQNRPWKDRFLEGLVTPFRTQM